MLHAALPAAGAAGLAPSAGRAAAAAFLTQLAPLDLDGPRNALQDLLEFHVDEHSQALARAGSGPAAREPAEEVAQAEEILAEEREDVLDVGVLPVVDARAPEARDAELIVTGPLVGVGEDLVGLGALFEALLGRLVARIAVRVKLHRGAPVRLLDLLGVRAARHRKNGVIIFVAGHRVLHSGRPTPAAG